MCLFLGETIRLRVSQIWRRVNKPVLFTELSKLIAVITFKFLSYLMVGETNFIIHPLYTMSCETFFYNYMCHLSVRV